MGIIRDYMNANSITQYTVATSNGLVPNAIQRQMTTSPDKVTTRTYYLLAKVLEKTPEQVFHEIRGMNEKQSITLNQLRLQVCNYLESRPGTHVIDVQLHQNPAEYVTVDLGYLRDNGKQRSISITLRILADGMPSIRSGRDGQAFYLYGVIKKLYHCDPAISEILDNIIMEDNRTHPL